MCGWGRVVVVLGGLCLWVGFEGVDRLVFSRLGRAANK